MNEIIKNIDKFNHKTIIGQIDFNQVYLLTIIDNIESGINNSIRNYFIKYHGISSQDHNKLRAANIASRLFPYRGIINYSNLLLTRKTESTDCSDLAFIIRNSSLVREYYTTFEQNPREITRIWNFVYYDNIYNSKFPLIISSEPNIDTWTRLIHINQSGELVYIIHPKSQYLWLESEVLKLDTDCFDPHDAAHELELMYYTFEKTKSKKNKIDLRNVFNIPNDCQSVLQETPEGVFKLFRLSIDVFYKYYNPNQAIKDNELIFLIAKELLNYLKGLNSLTDRKMNKSISISEPLSIRQIGIAVEVALGEYRVASTEHLLFTRGGQEQFRSLGDMENDTFQDLNYNEKIKFFLKPRKSFHQWRMNIRQKAQLLAYYWLLEESMEGAYGLSASDKQLIDVIIDRIKSVRGKELPENHSDLYSYISSLS